ncbi:MAG: integrase core domain-containing protein [Ottowia sp.]
MAARRHLSLSHDRRRRSTWVRRALTCIAHWRRDYNEVRPHSSLGRIPPARFAQQHRQRAGGAADSEQKQNFD